MKKKVLLSIVLCLALTAAMSYGALAASSIKLIVNGKQVQTDLISKNGTTYVPLRLVSEQLGAKVGWDNATQTITITGAAATTAATAPTTPPAKPKDGEYTADGLTFSQVSVENTQYGWKVVAEVKNTSDKDVQGVVFKATFYDADGKRVGTAEGSSSNLKPDQSKTESLVTSDDLTGYKTIKFQVEMSY